MGSHASAFEQNNKLNQHNLRQKRICVEFTITGNATPASKTHGTSDLHGVMLLRTEGKTSTVDAIETVVYATPDDGPTSSVFGVMFRGGAGYLGQIAKVLSIRVTDRGGTSSSLAVTRYGTFGLTTGGNIAFSIAATGLDLTNENADIIVEVEYETGENNSAVITVGGGGGVGGLGLGPSPVNLGTAINYRVLTQSGISDAGTSAITGDMGVSPIAATAITGFSLVLDGSGTFSTSAKVTGRVYAADYSPPTPAQLTQAITDKNAAYTDALSRAPDAVELGAGNLGGMTLVAGVYKFSTGVTIPTGLTLTGGANDVWIFQIAGDLTLASATSVTLTGGALAANVYWATFSATNLDTTSTFRGNLISQTSIAMKTNSVIHGRLMAGTAVTLDSTTVSS